MNSFGTLCRTGILVAATTAVASGKEIYNTQEESIPMMPAQRVASGMKLPDGFRATVFANEPDVHQPIALSFDTRGRLWVAENYTYSEAAVNFDTDLRDRILIFEDTNGDGRADSRKIFWDDALRLTSILPAFGGVYAVCPPYLVFLPDRNGDDLPDGQPEVLLDGFNDNEVRHTLANGLKLGPDGWIYGRHGIMATSYVGKPGTPKEERTPVNGSIWRFHPGTRKFEMVVQGTTNPWGTDWDENGELFFINTVIGHLWHVLPGAWFKRMYGEPFNPYAYELIDQTGDHVHWDTREAWNDINKGTSASTAQAGGGHAHTGLLIYQGNNWPKAYRNSLFTLNFHGKRINNDLLSRDGSGYVGRHGPDFMFTDDPYFRGIDLIAGPEGGVYVADWSDIGECHDNEAIHRTSGRLYRITHGMPQRNIRGDLAKMESSELVKLQSHPDEWVVRKARQVLQERALRGENMGVVRRDLEKAFHEQPGRREKLRALWALYVTGGVNPEMLRALLAEKDEHLRVWGIRLLVDRETPSTEIIGQFAQMARRDDSGLVLAYLASALQRIPVDSRWELGQALAARGDFNGDRVLPLMIWYGMAEAVATEPDKAAHLIERSQMQKVSALATRAVFGDLRENAGAADAIVQLLGSDNVRNAQSEMLVQISSALNGMQNPKAPASWSKVAPGLIEAPDANTRSLALELDATLGNARSQAALMNRLQDQQTDIAARRRALEILIRIRAKNLPAALEKLLADGQMAADAARAFARVDANDAPAILLARFEKLDATAQREAVNALASRPASALQLLDAIHRGEIPRNRIDATQLRQLRGLNHSDVNAQLSRIWPHTEEGGSKAQLFAKYKALLTDENLAKADLSRGRAVYAQSCGVCHKLYGEGADIGPELTGSDRKNLDYLLDNIVNPSGVVPEAYRVSLVNMRDDQVLTGILTTQSDQSITVQTVSDRLTLPRQEVDSIQESALSMMPDGILESLSEQQILDLVAYLRSSNPVPAPEPAGGK